MSVTGVVLADREATLHQIERLVQSNILHGSESLCKLLRYLAEQSIGHPAGQVKEYQIATEVFGRQHDFDPRLDSTVRVQTGRLRSKLAEYYATVARAEDKVLIELPKGAYTLTFHPRQIPAEILSIPVPAPPIKTSNRWRTAAILLSAGLCAVLAVLVYALANPQLRPASVLEGVTAEQMGAFRAFWKVFTARPDYPLVVFSNAEFVGRPETGMRYRTADEPAEKIMDHYTGIGEVAGIHELDRVFTLLNHGVRVKRGRLLSLDDAKNSDLIFLGSPSENLTLREIPSTQDFSFRIWGAAPRKGDLYIANPRPRDGELATYFASAGPQTTEDYALIGLVPGMSPNRRALILAGITTQGTQAAAEFVSRAATIEELLFKLTGSKHGELRPFEAVIRVKVSKGVPVRSQIVALHHTDVGR